jgi:hypothetical protein
VRRTLPRPTTVRARKARTALARNPVHVCRRRWWNCRRAGACACWRRCCVAAEGGAGGAVALAGLLPPRAALRRQAGRQRAADVNALAGTLHFARPRERPCCNARAGLVKAARRHPRPACRWRYAAGTGYEIAMT